MSLEARVRQSLTVASGKPGKPHGLVSLRPGLCSEMEGTSSTPSPIRPGFGARKKEDYAVMGGPREG